MENETAVLLAAILLSITALSMLAINDWRLSLILLSLQYTGMFLLLSTQWPASMAVIKIIAGWISAAVLGIAVSAVPEVPQKPNPMREYYNEAVGEEQKVGSKQKLGVGFKLFAAGLILLTLASRIFTTEPIFAGVSPTYIWGGAVLIGLGVLKLGFTSLTFHVILALLTTLAGFEILYGALDKTVFSAGLLSTITMIIALSGAYLLTAPSMETER